MGERPPDDIRAQPDYVQDRPFKIKESLKTLREDTSLPRSARKPSAYLCTWPTPMNLPRLPAVRIVKIVVLC